MTKLGENPKPEIRNPKQIPMTKIQNSKQFFNSVWDIGIWNFGFVSDFDIRISDFPARGGFGFRASPGGFPGIREVLRQDAQSA